MRLENRENRRKGRCRRLQRNAVGTPDNVRLTCILMFDNGRSSKAISEDLGISIATVYRYVGDYQSGGVENLLESHCKGYWGKLDSMQLCALRNELREHVYTDAKSVSEWIRVTFGVSYTPQGTVDLLNRIGFTYKKTMEVPCEADAGKQAEFVKELAGILSSKEENAVVYYADGVHPTHNSRSTYAWIEKGERMEQPTVSGRDRVNIKYYPNLNLIERLWKFLRKKVINTGFYRTKEEFRRAIRRFFDNIESFKEELESLLTLNFRLCNSQNISF